MSEDAEPVRKSLMKNVMMMMMNWIRKEQATYPIHQLHHILRQAQLQCHDWLHCSAASISSLPRGSKQ